MAPTSVLKGPSNTKKAKAPNPFAYFSRNAKKAVHKPPCFSGRNRWVKMSDVEYSRCDAVGDLVALTREYAIGHEVDAIKALISLGSEMSECQGTNFTDKPVWEILLDEYPSIDIVTAMLEIEGKLDQKQRSKVQDDLEGFWQTWGHLKPKSSVGQSSSSASSCSSEA